MAPLPKPHNYDNYSLDTERQAVSQLRKGHLEHLERVIQFLEFDPYTHGSGYLKELAWRTLRHISLGEEQKIRLRRTMLSYVRKRLTREVPAMARCASVLVDDFLRSELEKLHQSDDPAAKRRAT